MKDRIAAGSKKAESSQDTDGLQADDQDFEFDD